MGPVDHHDLLVTIIEALGGEEERDNKLPRSTGTERQYQHLEDYTRHTCRHQPAFN
jgi:hypothetical protein